MPEKPTEYEPPPSDSFVGAVALAALVLVALPGATRGQPAANSAHELTFWAGVDQVVNLSDAQLDGFADMGVGAFVMQTKFLTDGWTDNPGANLNRAGKYAMQRADPRLADSPACGGARDRPLSRLLRRQRRQRLDPLLRLVRRRGLGAHGREDGRPRRGRAHARLPGDRDRPGALRREGALDLELPGQHAHRGRGPRQGQAARPPGDDGDPGRLPRGRDRDLQLHAEGLVARVRLRNDRQPPLSRRAEYRHVRSARGHRLLGRDDLGRGLLGDPPVEQRVLQGLAARERPPGARSGGRTRCERTSRTPPSSSRRSSRTGTTPQRATTRRRSPGSTPAPSARRGTTLDRPSYVQTQLTAMRKFGMGGGFANYHYGGGLTPSKYAPYADAIRAAATPGNVDAAAPTLDAAAAAGEHPRNGPRQPRGLGPSAGGTTSGEPGSPSWTSASPRGSCSTSRTGKWTGGSPGRRSRTAPAR